MVFLLRRPDEPGSWGRSPEIVSIVLGKHGDTYIANGQRFASSAGSTAGARRAAKAQPGTGEDLYTWLLPWFNLQPALTDGGPEQLLAFAPYPGDADLPFGHDLAERLTLAMPRSDNATATWWFDACRTPWSPSRACAGPRRSGT